MKKRLIRTLLKIGLIMLPALPMTLQKNNDYSTPEQKYCLHAINEKYVDEVQKEVFEDSLEVNCDNRLRKIVKLDEERGQNQLIRISQGYVNEEQWMFLAKENLWIETGICQNRHSTNTNFYLSNSIFFGHYSDTLNLTELQEYHLHPSGTIEEIPQKYRNYFIDWAEESDPTIRDDKDRTDSLLEKWINCGNIRPSYIDIGSASYNLETFNHIWFGTRNLRFFIASSLGITEYGFTNSFFELLEKNGQHAVDEYIERYKKRNEKFYRKMQYNDVVNLSEQEICQKIVEIVSDDTVCVYFHPANILAH